MGRLIIDGHVLADPRPSGITHYARGLIAELDRRLGHPDLRDLKVTIVSPLERTASIRRLGLRNIRWRRNPIPTRVMRELVYQDRLPPMDQLFGRGVYYNPYFHTWPLRSSGAITSVHDLTFEEIPEFSDDFNARWLRRAVRTTAERADYIGCLTHTMADKITDFYGLAPGRTFVAEPAADAGHFYRRSASEIAAAEAKYGIPANSFLSVGNIEPRKNQISLVYAYLELPEDVRKRHPLVILGADGWKSRKVTDMAAEATRRGAQILVLQGKVTDEDLPAIYSGAAALAYPSLYEGFGMPIVEAMACGTPVILSNASVMPEVGGDAPMYVDPTDISSITKALIAIDSLPLAERDAMIDRGYQQSSQYQWSNAVDALLGAYQKAAR